MKILGHIVLMAAATGWAHPAQAQIPGFKISEEGAVWKALQKRNVQIQKQRQRIELLQRLDKILSDDRDEKQPYIQLKWRQRYKCWWPLYNESIALRFRAQYPLSRFLKTQVATARPT